MSPLRLNGSSSGYTEVTAPATAANNTLTLPTSNGTSGQVLTTNGSGALSFSTVAASQWTTTGSDVYYTTGKVLVGTATANASGGVLQLSSGITFPATQVASSDANTLDDYEEGTFTPTVGGNATYTSREGTYVKIGKNVTIIGSITINVLGTGSQSISGLPFVASTTCPLRPGYFSFLAVSTVYLAPIVPGNTSQIDIYGLAAAGTITSGQSVLGNGARLDFTGTYTTS